MYKNIMKINLIVHILSSLILLGEAKKFNFNVISIMGDSVSIAVKYGNNIFPLTSSSFPVFTSSIETDNINQYKYVAIDKTGQQIDEENIIRTYSESNVKEIYNRQPKKIEIPKLDEPFKRQYSMGSDKLQSLPNNVIYNVYAKCDEAGYTDLSSFPFIDGSVNTNTVNCTFSIVTPDYHYSSTGNIHVLGYGSRTYRKLSWGIKFDKKFMGRKAVKLRAMASDPTLIREKLSIELYKSVGVPVQEGTYARLIINNDVYGLYLIIDSISSKWVKAYIHGDDKAKLGVSYKMYSCHPSGPFADLKYIDDNYETYRDYGSYKLDEFDELEAKDEPSQWSRLVDFIKLFDNWVKTYDNDTSDKAVEELKKFLNIESLLRMLVVDSLIVGIDNFYLYNSNAALYYNPQRNNYQFIPYDFDQTLIGTKGSPDLDSENFMSDCITWVNYNDNEIFDHFFTKSILKHPQIKKRYDIILAKAVTETYNGNKVHAFVHALADLIRDDVSWNFELINSLNIGYKDSDKNSFVNHFTLQNFEGNIDYEHVGYDGNSYDDANYGIQAFVDARGEKCKAYTANVDTSDNTNISDDYNDVKVPKASSSSSLSFTSNTTRISLLFLLSQFIIYLIL